MHSSQVNHHFKFSVHKIVKMNAVDFLKQTFSNVEIYAWFENSRPVWHVRTPPFTSLRMRLWCALITLSLHSYRFFKKFFFPFLTHSLRHSTYFSGANEMAFLF